MQDCPCVPKITAEGRMRQKTQENASLPFEISEIQVDRQRGKLVRSLQGYKILSQQLGVSP